MTCKDSAFSLLEMTVMLAIILIIGVIAYPTMNQYLVQSKVADAITSAAPIQSLVTNQIASLGSVTGSGNNLNTPATISRFVDSYTISPDGVISITTATNAGAVSFTLSPVYDTTSEQVRWICAVDDADMNASVPSQCRI